jgi:glycosyltransferase involved in cell wall biosynthesis
VKKIIICIVAYNAETTIRKVLDRIPRAVREKVAEVVVFDDESKDKTFQTATEYRLENPDFKNFFVFRNPQNLGYGGNQKRCYRYCIDKGYDIVVLLHGDGQYAPECLPELLEPLEKGEADAVFGSRMMTPGAARKGGMPLYKFVGNKILTFYENAMLGMHLTEFHSGYRLYSVHALKEVPFEKNTNDFHFDTEIIVQFHARRLRIKELPIPVYYGDEICHVNGLKYAKDVFKAVFQYKLHELGIKNYPKYDVGYKRYAFKEDRHSSHAQVIRMIPPRGARILDVGCGPNDLAKFLKKEGNEIVGVDKYVPPPGESPRTMDIQKDLDEDFTLPFGREFDYILFLDVLEHLKDPARVLAKARDYLKPGGRIIVSLPNVAHWSVRFSLLIGRFSYGERGILDRTHLHFYTGYSARQLLREANYKVLSERVTPVPLLDAFPVFRFFFLRWIHWIDVAFGALWKGLFAYQFIFVAEDTFSSDYRPENNPIRARSA